ncbi:hypothetical protein OF83DRAFT_1131558 [Amylostereum chailletii]|nr:hypothetical protein OF83DRAFT_1131558 [Amylostereum chailletii]
MSFLDRLKDGVSRVIPDKHSSTPVSTSVSGGIGNGRGAMGFEDDMIVSKPAIVFHSSQVFFNFLAMCCFASVAAFQAKWNVGPSGLTGFALFVSISGIFLALFLVLIPVLYEKYDRFTRLARALKEVRVSFILVGAGTAFSLLIAFITTISAWTQAGCKNADNDPNADKGDSFKKGLDSWCSTKKAGAVFFWLAFGFWAASFTLAVLDWRKNKGRMPRDQPFTHPVEQDDADEESVYEALPPIRRMTREDDSPFADQPRVSSVPSASDYSVPSGGYASSPARPRQSMDTYGAFSDPAPSGFDAPANDGPRVSRTMQYADPYAAVRATVAGASTGPPSYSAYQGYK